MCVARKLPYTADIDNEKWRNKVQESTPWLMGQAVGPNPHHTNLTPDQINPTPYDAHTTPRPHHI